MKLGVSQFFEQSDATNIIPCLGHVTYTTAVVSRRPSSRWAVDAERGNWCGQGQGGPLLRSELRQEGQVGEAVAGSWRRWWGRGAGAGGRAVLRWTSL